MYPAELVSPMKNELTEVGLKELTSAEQVDAFIDSSKEGTAMVVINSVCGCAAGSLRPGVKMSLSNDKLPAQMATA